MSFLHGWWRLGIAAPLLFVLLLCGCADDPQALSWDVRFGDPSIAADVVAFESRITRGGCTGDEVYSVKYRRSGFDEDVIHPPTLAPGTYGFSVAALDSRCRVVAFACEATTLPDESGRIEVVLEAAAGQAACAPSLCDDGICEESDGGVPSDCPEGLANCNVDPTDGCEVDIRDDVAHCGGCGLDCRVPNGTPVCSSGVCSVESCEENWFDCDGDEINGCETSTLTLSDCGRCRAAGEGPLCALAHATASCATGSCELVECHPGWGDCDGTLVNGCETPLDTGTDCGACGAPCGGATPNCALIGATASCVATCPVEAPTLCDTTCVAAATDPRHCGGCAGPSCSLDHGSAACVAGTCTVEACNPEWADCDAVAANGCETATTTLADCGACAAACAAEDAATACATGSCAITECYGGRADCNGEVDDGCEADLASATTCGSCTEACLAPTALCGQDGATAPLCVGECSPPGEACGDRCLDTRFDGDNCGGCGVGCELPGATERCYFGVCEVVECEVGLGDCDGNPATGCEAPLDGDPLNCGACGIVCTAPDGAEPACAGGVCGSDCDPGFADCNGDPADGCETPLDTTTNCGRCGATCSPANGTGVCSSGFCAVSSCNAGFADCDGSAANGCEVDTNTDHENCGGCRLAGGVRCTGQERLCCMGTCARSCG